MVHLHAHSWYSFLAGASSPDALTQRAAKYGQDALALTDDWTLAGSVQHAVACKAVVLNPVHGARIVVGDVGMVLLAANREGYANLCDLLTLAHRNRLDPVLAWEDLSGRSDGLFCLVDLSQIMLLGRFQEAARQLQIIKGIFPNRVFIELVHHARVGDAWCCLRLHQLGADFDVLCVADRVPIPGSHF